MRRPLRLALSLALPLGAASACRTPADGARVADASTEAADVESAPPAQPDAAIPAPGAPAPAGLFQPGCFETHLRDALALNRARKPLYASLSGGATKRLSDQLIRGELVAILAAKVHDTRAAPFQRRGLTVMCAEFMPMSNAPEFDSTLRPLPPPSPLLATVDAEAMKDEGLAALAARGFAGADEFARAQIARLAPDAPYFCMTMHVLESTLRAAVLAPRHAARAAELGIDPPTSLSRDFISIQIKQLPFAVGLDRDARDLHQRGIPIVCQDVPKIPAE